MPAERPEPHAGAQAVAQLIELADVAGLWGAAAQQGVQLLPGLMQLLLRQLRIDHHKGLDGKKGSVAGAAQEAQDCANERVRRDAELLRDMLPFAAAYHLFVGAHRCKGGLFRAIGTVKNKHAPSCAREACMAAPTGGACCDVKSDACCRWPSTCPLHFLPPLRPLCCSGAPGTVRATQRRHRPGGGGGVCERTVRRFAPLHARRSAGHHCCQVGDLPAGKLGR